MRCRAGRVIAGTLNRIGKRTDLLGWRLSYQFTDQSRSEFFARLYRGMAGETLKVRVKAPAVCGKANTAAEQTVATALGLTKECVQIVKGKTATRKVIEITGLAESEIYQRLSKFAR